MMQSPAALDLGIRSPDQNDISLDLEDEKKKRKRLLDQAKASGAMSASWSTLMNPVGNQY